jgi:predicted enzyme related to lactoylglutathione lyase
MTVPLRFDSVFYYVRDLDRAVGFYGGVLGLTLRSRDAVARFDLDGVMVELVPMTDPGVPAGQGNARLCFAVHDVARVAAELQNYGVTVQPVQRKENGLLAIFHDPDGNELALWQDTTG